MTRDERQDIIIGICEADGIHMTYTTSGNIVDALDAERCVWTWENDINLYSTSCDDAWPLLGTFKFCPCCGKRIEVKDVHPSASK